MDEPIHSEPLPIGALVELPQHANGIDVKPTPSADTVDLEAAAHQADNTSGLATSPRADDIVKRHVFSGHHAQPSHGLFVRLGHGGSRHSRDRAAAAAALAATALVLVTRV